MLIGMSGPRPLRVLRATIVALTVLVLVPAWMARTAYVYACPSAKASARCCPVAAHKSKPRPATPEPSMRRACCAADEIELAPRIASAMHDDPALPSRDDIVVAVVTAPPVLAAGRGFDVAPRATGPPAYLRTLSLLL